VEIVRQGKYHGRKETILNPNPRISTQLSNKPLIYLGIVAGQWQIPDRPLPRSLTGFLT